MIDGNAFGLLTLLIVMANVVVHVALASVIWTDSHALEQQGHKLAFFGPYLWTVTVAISGIVAAGFYWMNIMAIAILSTVVAIYTYFQGMKLSGAVNASMLSTFEPVTTMVLAALFLGQHIGWLQMIGTALILSSAVLVAIHSKSD